MGLKIGWWYTMYRETPKGSLMKDQKTPFRRVKNNWNICAMDPFVFEHNSKTYIFAETYNSVKKRCSIGYCQWNGKGFSSWKEVIIEPFHMSYPFIFKHGEDIYIIPETFQAKSVIVYKAIQFPDKWERVSTLLDNASCVDTTPFELNGRYYAFTYDVSSLDNKTLYLYPIVNGKMCDAEKIAVSSAATARCGGIVFRDGERLIRTAQDCQDEYGRAIIFNEVNPNFSNGVQEKEIGRFSYDNIKGNFPKGALGVHNYSATNKFEVIDVKTKKIKLVSVIARCFSKLTKVFRHKER